MTGEDLATKTAEAYQEALSRLAAIVSSRPEAADAEQQVGELKEAVIQTMVAIGREREKFDEQAKSDADSHFGSLLWSLQGDSDVKASWDAMKQARDYYFGQGHTALADAIIDFNVITQYADFELLRRQSPGEAERLGVG